MLEEVAGQGAVCVAQDVFTIEQLTFAADVAERFIWADFGGNDIAGLRNGIIADSAIADFVRIVNRIHPAKDDARALLEGLTESQAALQRMIARVAAYLERNP